MHFINNTTGWASATGGMIHRTTDGGITWTSVNYGGLSWLNSVYFINATTGWSVGSNGLILKSTDGGVTWAQQNSGVTFELSDVHFADANNGWASSGAGLGSGNTASTILRTTDGGVTWTPVAVPVAATEYSINRFCKCNSGLCCWQCTSGF